MSVAATNSEKVSDGMTAVTSDRSSFSKPPVSPPTPPRSTTLDSDGSVDISISNNTLISPSRNSPYVVGFTTTAMRHQPPEPFGPGYVTEHPLSPRPDNWKSLSKLNYCLSRHLTGGRTIRDDTKTLTITAVIRTGHDEGAQLVVVNDDMVAKIYDPLYYSDQNEFGLKEDVVFHAYSDCSFEAAAYHELQKSPAAREVTPAFYGTWTIPIVTLTYDKNQVERHTRHIPLVLMERVQGETMRDIDARTLSKQIRSAVLKKILDADAVIYNAGISNRDVCSRNIIISGLQFNTEEDVLNGVSIKIVDFNVAIVRRHPQCYRDEIDDEVDQGYQAWLPKLPSPLIQWFHAISEFAWDGWCANEDGEPQLWLWENYHDDDRYIPVIWDPSNPDIRPEYFEIEDGSEKSVDSDLGLDMVVERGEEGGNKDGLHLAEHGTPVVGTS